MKLCILIHSLTSMLLMAPHVFAQGAPAHIIVNPTVSTSAVINDADDPAIWVHPADPAKSIIVVPTEFALEQNYPNPFKASTSIGFRIPHGGEVIFTIYNLIGQEIRYFAATQHATAGRYWLSWDGLDDKGRAVPTGIYY